MRSVAGWLMMSGVVLRDMAFSMDDMRLRDIVAVMVAFSMDDMRLRDMVAVSMDHTRLRYMVSIVMGGVVTVGDVM